MKKYKKFTAIQIAQFFISEGIKSKQPVNLMKLLDLLYIAQGVCLAKYDENLFEDIIIAWKYGPMIPIVYTLLKYYGTGPIKEQDLSTYLSDRLKNDSKTIELLTSVWNHFGKWTGVQLSNWTHMDGSPWYEIWMNRNGKNLITPIIHTDLIKEYFKKNVLVVS